MKNNLIQNFYIVGVTQEEIYSKSKEISSSQSSVSFIPKVISKFPDINTNYNTIPNEIIIEHCFPTGYNIIKAKKKEISQYIYHFWFELDNLKYNYLYKYHSFYSKIYFTCLKFNESLHDFDKLKSEINIIDKTDKKDSSIKDNNNNNNNSFVEDNAIFFPKVICFASLLPFHKELSRILQNLFDYLLYYNTNLNKNANSNDVFLINDLSPIEKIIEQIVMEIPFPISLKNDYCILYKFNFAIDLIVANTPNLKLSAKSKSTNLSKSLTHSSNNNNFPFPFNYTNINFQKYDPLNSFLNNIQSISLSFIFLYFTEEEVTKIFKYILLEIPILFFSENIEILSRMVEGFLSLLHPFEYVQPHISILPSKFYGIINTENKFVFGINEDYNPDFFKNNNILLDKTIIVVHFPNQKGKIEEIKKLEDQKDLVIIDNYNIFNFIKNESVLPNGSKIEKTNIELPLKQKKKLINKIKSFLNDYKKKRINTDGEYGNIFNQKIRHIFYKFFIFLLSGFTDYLQRINKYELNDTKKDGFYFGDNIRFKLNCNNSSSNNDNNNININNNETLLIRGIFNMDEFISKYPKDSHAFYKVFCNTKLFYSFIRKLIFLEDEQISLSIKYFKVLTFFKQHKELRKPYKYKERFATYEEPFKIKSISKPNTKIFINILNDMSFNSEEKNILIEKRNKALIDYNQIINIKTISTNENIFIKYIIFPKLLFDNSFFDISFDKLFYRHYLDLPTNKEILELYKDIIKLNKEYDEQYEELIYSKNQNEPINNSEKNLIDLSRGSNISFFRSNSNVSNKNMEILVENYIEYNWFLLISCSLWYCTNQTEIDIRIGKILDVLEKIDFIEEQVLFFLYMSIYKYGSKPHFIKMFEYMCIFMGYSNYTNLLFLCLKLNQKDKENKDSKKTDDTNDNKNKIKIRSFCDMKEIKSILNKSENSEEINKSNENTPNLNQKEQIDFYTLQICPKCKEENSIANIYDLIHHRISKKRENLFYKCSKCGEENIEIKIRYKIYISNKKKGESLMLTEGKFKLIPPHIIYQEMKDYLLNLNHCQLDIDNIFSNNKIHLLNNIFYFSDKFLPFDFLIPYEGQGIRDYFYEDEENNEDNEEEKDKNEIIMEDNKNKKEKQKLNIFSINNNFNFSLFNK